MFTASDLDSWGFSVVVMLFILSILTGFGVFVYVLVSRIWGEERDEAKTGRMSGAAKGPPFRKAA